MWSFNTQTLIAILATFASIAVGHLGNGEFAIEFLSVFNNVYTGDGAGHHHPGKNSLETAIGIHIANNVIVSTFRECLNFLGDLFNTY
jgi:hypothetical protein